MNWVIVALVLAEAIHPSIARASDGGGTVRVTLKDGTKPAQNLGTVTTSKLMGGGIYEWVDGDEDHPLVVLLKTRESENFIGPDVLIDFSRSFGQKEEQQIRRGVALAKLALDRAGGFRKYLGIRELVIAHGNLQRAYPYEAKNSSGDPSSVEQRECSQGTYCVGSSRVQVVWTDALGVTRERDLETYLDWLIRRFGLSRALDAPDAGIDDPQEIVDAVNYLAANEIEFSGLLVRIVPAPRHSSDYYFRDDLLESFEGSSVAVVQKHFLPVLKRIDQRIGSIAEARKRCLARQNEELARDPKAYYTRVAQTSGSYANDRAKLALYSAADERLRDERKWVKSQFLEALTEATKKEKARLVVAKFERQMQESDLYKIRVQLENARRSLEDAQRRYERAITNGQIKIR